MAEAYGGQGGSLYNGTDYIQAWLTANITSQTDTKATVSIGGQLRLVGAYKYGVELVVGYYYSGSSGSYASSNSYQTYYTYLDSGWYPNGYCNATITFDKSTSAKNITFFAWAHGVTVNGYSGYPYSSEAQVTLTIPAGVFEYAPNAPTSVTLTKSSDSTSTLSWAFTAGTNRPITKQERALETNGVWGTSTAIANNTTKSASIATTTNSRYRGRVRLGNNTGWSAWVNSGYVYTTPATPSSAVGIQTNTSVSLTCDASNVRYFTSYQWQRASSADFSDAVTLTGTTANVLDTTTLTSPYYRVRVLSPDGSTYSTWKTVSVTKNPVIYCNIPEGGAISAVYVWKEDQQSYQNIHL